MVKEYIDNVTETMSRYFNHQINFVMLDERTESVATWITVNIKHLQHPSEVRVSV